jgi:putative ABC transport system permease protein
MRNALGQLTNKPSFSAVVIVTLGLTIGAATTVFSLLDAVLLRPFPYPHPEQLVRVRTAQVGLENSVSDASLPDFWDHRDRNTSFSRIATYISFCK